MKIPQNFSVDVSEREIAVGEKCSARFCPIAVGVKSKFDCKEIFIYVNNKALIDGVWYVHDGRKFIDDFDLSNNANPTTVNFSILEY